jgi:hypothetical protein
MTGIAYIMDAFKNNPQAIILIVGLIILLIANYIIKRRDKMRGQDGESFLGLRPISTDHLWDYIGKKKFSILSPWFAPVSIFDPYQGNYKGFDVCLFQLGISDGSRGGSSQTAIHVKGNNIDLPKFILKPTDFGQRLSELFGASDINFPSTPVFSSNYFLKGDNEGRIRSLFHPQILSFFQEHEGITIETSGNALLVFKYRDQGKKENYAAYIDRALNIIELFTRGDIKPQLTESFADEKPEVKAKKIMTAASLNVTVNALIIAMLYYQVGGKLAIIIGIILIMESIGFLIYAKWKQRELRTKV